MLSVEIVVGKEPIRKGPIKTESRPLTTKDKFLADLDENALPVFQAIFDLAEKKDLPLRWGSVGFSLSTIIDDIFVPFLMGFPKSSAYSQMIYTYYPTVAKKIKKGEQLFETFKNELMQTRLFEKAEREMKYVIRSKPTKEQIENLVSLVLKFAEQIRENGLIE